VIRALAELLPFLEKLRAAAFLKQKQVRKVRVAGRVGCPSVGQGLGPLKRPGPKTLRL